MRWSFGTVIAIIIVHVTCIGLWSVQGFVVPSIDTIERISVARSIPQPSASYHRTSLLASAKDNPEKDEKEGKLNRFVKFFQGDKDEEPTETPKKRKSKSGESAVVRLVKRVTKKKDDKDDSAQATLRVSSTKGESVVVRLFRRVTRKEQEEEEDAVAKMVQEKELPEVLPLSFFKSVIRSATFQDAVESGDLTPEAEQKIINELRRGAEMKRQQQRQEEQKRKEEQRAQLLAKKEAEKLAIERAKEKRQQLQKQKALLERQKAIQAAAASKAKVENESDKVKEKRTGRRYASAAQKFIRGVMDNFDNKEEWIVVGPKTILAPGEIVPVTAGGLDLLVVASKDGRKLYCIANACPHLGTPLETGRMEKRPNPGMPGAPFEDCIVCPLHRTAFALESGEVRGEWSPHPPVLGQIMAAVKTQTPVAVFDVRARGKNIEVRINSSLDELGNKAQNEKKGR